MFNAVSSIKVPQIIIEQTVNAVLEGKAVPGGKPHAEKELMVNSAPARQRLEKK